MILQNTSHASSRGNRPGWARGAVEREVGGILLHGTTQSLVVADVFLVLAGFGMKGVATLLNASTEIRFQQLLNEPAGNANL